MRRVRLLFTSALIVVGLVACCCQPTFGPVGIKAGGGQGGNKEAGVNNQVLADPAEQAAVQAVKGHGGFVNQEGGHVVEVSLFQPSVTDDTLKDLAPLTRTRKLKLTNSKVTGPGLRHLAGMQELTDLDLWGSPIDDAGAKELANLRQLKMLNVSGSKITGPGFRELAPLTQLEDLTAAGMQLGDTGVVNIATNLKHLRRLAVDNNQFGDVGVMAIAEMPNLRVLIINGVHFTDQGLAALTRVKTLEELVVSWEPTDKSAKIIANCKSLRVLRLFNTHITDVGLRDIGALPNLQELELRSNSKMSTPAIAEFIKTHPSCNVKQMQ